MNFTDLALIPPLTRAVGEAGYTAPSPIQEKAIPPVLAGRDLLGCAQTGTGKTAAFALPILQLLSARKPAGKRAIRSLILTPTRELALQISESFTAYGKHLPLRATVIFGGVGQGPQVAQLQRGVDILVATPGRLNDLIGQGHIHLDAVEIFVLDEADRMLDMGFVQDVKKVLKFLPEKRQTLLFSATMPNEIVALANQLLHKPAKVFVTPVSSTVEAIDQTVYKVDKTNKRHLLAKLLGDLDVTSTLVFTRTKHGADRVVRELKRAGIQALAIHGNKSQNARQDALASLKTGKVKVLVATDIAARGLDIAELSHVFNYDLPNIPETYVHRIGRTGRAGLGGTAVSFCSADELPYLADIEKLIGFKIKEVKDHPWPMGTAEGPAPAPTPQAGKSPRPEKKSKPAEKPPKAPRKTTPAPQQKAPAAKAPGAAPKPPPARARQPQRPLPPDPYDGLSGGKAIVTKKPVWSSSPAGQPAVAEPDHKEGESTMSRNNRRRGKQGRGNPSSPAQQPGGKSDKKSPPDIKKDENGLFNFSDEELATDDSIKLINRNNSDVKYASFEDYMKDH